MPDTGDDEQVVDYSRANMLLANSTAVKIYSDGIVAANFWVVGL
jgi:hypothetical protein